MEHQRATCDARAMGFDPTRKHRRTRADYVYVAAGLLVCAALLAWAFLG
jgi:hypothetical protein